MTPKGCAATDSQGWRNRTAIAARAPSTSAQAAPESHAAQPAPAKKKY